MTTCYSNTSCLNFTAVPGAVTQDFQSRLLNSSAILLGKGMKTSVQLFVQSYAVRQRSKPDRSKAPVVAPASTTQCLASHFLGLH
jgi:hypothetical protein